MDPKISGFVSDETKNEKKKLKRKRKRKGRKEKKRGKRRELGVWLAIALQASRISKLTRCDSMFFAERKACDLNKKRRKNRLR